MRGAARSILHGVTAGTLSHLDEPPVDLRVFRIVAWKSRNHIASRRRYRSCIGRLWLTRAFTAEKRVAGQAQCTYRGGKGHATINHSRRLSCGAPDGMEYAGGSPAERRRDPEQRC